MRHLFIIFICLLFTLTISAQDSLTEVSYHLRQPTLDDYIQNFRPIIEQWRIATQADNNAIQPWIDEILNIEIEASYDQLAQYDAETLYFILNGYRESYSNWIDQSRWGQAIILSWLNQNQIDLASTSEFELHDLKVAVTSRDFNGDDINEYVLDVQSDLFSQFLVLQTSNRGYQLLKSPLPWLGCCSTYWSQQSDVIQEQGFQDLNADGLPEWILAESGYGGGGFKDGKLFVLQWENGELIDLTPDLYVFGLPSDESSIFPRNVDVVYENTDSSDAIEIITHQQFNDSWGCNSIETRIFSWNASENIYSLSDQYRDFDDSAGCNLRFAQDAIWSNDYSNAIPLLEQSIQQFSKNNINSDQAVPNNFQAYASIRLALAYAMTGQIDKAKTTINHVNPAPDDKMIVDLLDSAQTSLNTRANASDLCFSMFNVFSRYYLDWQMNPYWGNTEDYIVAWAVPTSYPPRSNSAAAGCDAYGILDKILQETLLLSIQPLEYLRQYNIPIEGYFHADLNQDGIEEWLIWIDLHHSDPILYISGEKYYQTSRPNWFTNPPSDYRQWFEWQLPDGEPVWGLLHFDDEHTYSEIYISLYGSGGGGTIGYCLDEQGEFNKDLYPGDLVLFRLDEENEFDFFFKADICEGITLEDIFPQGTASTEIFAWDAPTYNDDVDYPLVATRFIWDAQEHTYITAESQPVPTAIQATDSLAYPDENRLEYYQIRPSLEDKPEQVLEIVDNFLSHIDDAHDFSNLDIQAAYYYRAFAYEKLGHNDEALADYVTLYTQAGNTAWGMLAGLHIEPDQ